MGKGPASEPRKPKTPLAELKIDAQTMNMKTVIKCANAKDRAKSIAAQLAKVTPLHALLAVLHLPSTYFDYPLCFKFSIKAERA